MRTDRIEEAISMARELDPGLIIDGPMQADTALIEDIQENYPFMEFEGPANVLICPNLASANIAYKLLQRVAGAEMTGPILEGLANQHTSFKEMIALEKLYIWLQSVLLMLKGMLRKNSETIFYFSLILLEMQIILLHYSPQNIVRNSR